MHQNKTAKLFQNGRSQAVRLPAEFRFEGGEVLIHRDEATGNVILSALPGLAAWGTLLNDLPRPAGNAGIMRERPMNQPLARPLRKPEHRGS